MGKTVKRQEVAESPKQAGVSGFDFALSARKHETIGGRLKAWREAVRLTQAEAATQLGMPLRTFQNYEMDARAPGADAIEGFVRGGINANWLLTGEGPMLLSDLQPGAVASEPELDIEVLTGAIQGLERFLQHDLPPEHLAHVTPEDKARTVAALYKMFKSSK